MLEVSLIGLILLALILFFIKCTYKREDVPKEYIKNFDKKSTFDINKEGITDIFVSEGEKLRVLQLTDIHYDINNSKKEKTLELLSSVMLNNPSDLIVLTGDWCADPKNVKENSMVVFDIIDKYGIPWAPVFGNHDDEGDLSQVKYIKVFEGYKNCLFKTGYTNLGCLGNYIINARERSTNKLLTSLFMINSNSSMGYFKSQYEPIWTKQIEWYEWAVDGLNKEYLSENNTVAVIPSFAFFHIPLVEFAEVYDKAESLLDGENRQRPDVPIKNTHFMDAIVDNNSTKAVFVGHDHNNNAVMLYKGIKLVYGVQSGWTDKYGADSVKGGRMIAIDSRGEMDTTIIPYDI